MHRESLDSLVFARSTNARPLSKPSSERTTIAQRTVVVPLIDSRRVIEGIPKQEAAIRSIGIAQGWVDGQS
jgi:hypothetical protein